ncbi:MAG: cupin [Deltaproteobacteria bacterium CG_4_10_14_3_um_filter_60_8]|nr:MAG: cupin [Desulfobacterales bacterium CG2_30_60_27]PIP43762.1 MAG: cupin [Deltaproteobacteria bacterium CG23_combo_of_CG06-09_8_20_14_all_60_8]PIY25121.1 MAG: cupin [Deltaproteobacteria bacterium CG_4_10_14_3_um_filter_60_8]
MRKIELDKTREFTAGGMKRFFLVQDSAYFKIINFNLAAGQTFPVHSHAVDGQLSILVLEGNGQFLGDQGAAIPAKPGDLLISDIAAPHGVHADTDMRILVTIAPPI